jgi:class 3 adenylate cyclase
MSYLSIFIPTDRRQALANDTTLGDRTSGAALFADISGFSPLTEALLQGLGPQRGAEELTRHLNSVFETLISVVTSHGGSVVGFSGDAITCWFEGDNGLLATGCAVQMQDNIAGLEGVLTPAGDQIKLALKAAVAVGEVRRFGVGDPDDHKLDVLAGELLDELAQAESLARKGDVILAPSAVANLSDLVEYSPAKNPQNGGDVLFGVVKQLRVDPAEVPIPTTDPLRRAVAPLDPKVDIPKIACRRCRIFSRTASCRRSIPSFFWD